MNLVVEGSILKEAFEFERLSELTDYYLNSENLNSEINTRCLLEDFQQTLQK